MNITEIQKKLAAAFGPSGQESAVADVIEKIAAPFADEVRRDVLGSLIVRKKGTGKKVMFSAHMDTIGLIVTHIDKKGFARFAKIGGVPNGVSGAKVVFANGTRGIVFADRHFTESKSTDDMYIDVGAENADAARGVISVGDIAVYDGDVRVQGDRLLSPYLDNRISCAVLLRALEEIKNPKNDLYFVFSAQKEIGLRGAKTAAFGIDPDYGFAVDVTDAGDTPERKPVNECFLGGGAAIKHMDSFVLCHPKVIEYLHNAAEKNNVKVQREVLRAGGTDAGAIHSTRAGVYTGAISVPTRYIHNSTEMCDLRDVEECVKLAVLAADIEL
ncbi:MAG: M42 family metallopeptidase [Oscillospiraceae bacterium]|nr:M42 family metallopeptidase [Oscillospiraceae bacterium]